MTKSLKYLVLVISALGVCRLSVAAEQNVIADTISEIHMTNGAEVAAGELAKSKSPTKEVKNFADQLIKDHKTADKKLVGLAKKNHISIDQQPLPEGSQEKKMTHDELQGLDKIRKLPAEEFDQAFLEYMTKGHQDGIRQLEAAQEKLKGSPFEALVKKQIPILEQHLKMAKNIQAKLNKEK